MSKRARMTHLDTSNTSYGQNKGRESNCQFDSQPLKVRNRLDFLMCKWCTTYHWKALNKGYKFASELISIRTHFNQRFARKVMGPQSRGSLNFGSLGTKCHLGVDPMARHKVYYKGEGGGFPQVRVMVGLVNLSLHVVRPSTQSVSAMH
jgi:hypothetical protein